MGKKFLKVKIAALIICAVGLVLLVYAGYMFVTQINDYSKAAKLYENTAQDYVLSKYDEEAAEDEKNWEDLVDVDILKLREQNEDIVGWIYFENEDISYPVLYSEDDSTYLRKTYTGESLSAGSIFMEGQNNRDFSDVHTIIYGHNMRDLSMFGRLKYYIRDKEYIAGHEYFQIITEKEKLRYKIISCKIVTDDSDVYTVYKSGSQEFLNFVKDVIQSGNVLDTNSSIKYDDHLITLSTCTNDDRLVVSAVRCDECSVNN